MFCDEALDSVEAVAAGDRAPEGRVAAHLASCVQCARALQAAREVERLLRGRAVPAPPAQFAARTLARVRRERWRHEQVVDAGFNLVLSFVIVALVGGVWLVVNRSGLTTVGRDAVGLFGTGVRALTERAAPALPLYAGAAALVAAGLALWWWTERAESL